MSNTHLSSHDWHLPLKGAVVKALVMLHTHTHTQRLCTSNPHTMYIHAKTPPSETVGDCRLLTSWCQEVKRRSNLGLELFLQYFPTSSWWVFTRCSHQLPSLLDKKVLMLGMTTYSCLLSSLSGRKVHVLGLTTYTCLLSSVLVYLKTK